MKRMIFYVATLGAVLFLFADFCSAQDPFPHIVQGRILNPDGTKPDSGEIRFIAYLTNDPTDQIVSVCSDSGGWAVETKFGFIAGDAGWEPGTVLHVDFENIGEGAFNGAVSWIEYTTTNTSPEYAGDYALPVELTAFEAAVERAVTGDRICLNWSTLGETNNFGFEVQKSDDGALFEKIGFVTGAGSTSTPRSYNFVDADVAVGTYFYRLKQIDTNGSFEISDTREVVVTPPHFYELGQNYPNPFNPSTEIVFRLKENSHVQLTVYDVLGKEVERIVDRPMKAGTHKISVQANNWATGVYFYSIQANKFKAVKKMVLMR